MQALEKFYGLEKEGGKDSSNRVILGLAQYPSDMPPQPAPYSMCRKEECDDRQSSGEVSIFERMSSSIGRSSSLQAALQNSQTKATKDRYAIDPCLAVSKYRRSAAGVTDRYPPRTMEQLHGTVQYLQQLLIAAPSRSPDGVPVSYLSVVEFVQDRFRAVQVDLTRSQQTSKRIQLSMIRSQILIIYFMADVPEYSSKLGMDALKAALSNYWLNTKDSTEIQREWDDEVLAYTLLLQVCCEEPLSFSELYRKVYRGKGELLNWSLRLAGEWAQGNWFIVLKLLREGSNHATFSALVRCCVARQLSHLRWNALQMYNVTWGRAEAVPLEDVARLLMRKDSATFCQACGLSLTDTKDAILFEVSQLEQPAIVFPIRDDDFVFGPSGGSFRSVTVAKISLKLPSIKYMTSLCFF
ncbi:hypothetical protein FisN_32Lh001 [Fistulifera solaris]|uniref:SAC3/GANP/THP3 conserved domain-containing protein n=1 Tax=Fistulifera solaris TaxID=1519565 RepID=A0A1Z5KPF4_FISSO|nr:hypothetical protein FisN_32Lh001 [Fistulifera solaris]|eukprot:GAX27982.1 hypothetical protein FisN_32Lh001 [Fistulifera solaris]